jgi:transcriptional regulator of acetoin/glycerol metabolism
VRTDWERFHLGEEALGVREEILTSWRRSRLSGVDPDRVDLPWVEPDVDTRFARAAGPVLTRLADLLVGDDTCLAVTNPAGQVLWRWVSDPALRRELDEMAVVEGFCFDEEHAGTNGLGTSLESRRVTMVRGDEHFKEPFHRFTCVAAPVPHPLTRRIVGAVNITCRAADTNDRLQPAVLALVREVQEALLHAAGTRERALFDAFLAHARSDLPVITLGPELLIKNDAAAAIEVDHRQLWARVLQAVEDGGPLELPELDERTARLRLVAEGRQVSGAVLVLDRHEPRPGHSSETGERTTYGRSAATVTSALDREGAVVLRGEPGTGKRHLLAEVLAERGNEPLALDCAAVDLAGLSASVREAASAGRPLLLTHLQALSPADADALAAVLSEAGARVTGTVTAADDDGLPQLTRLLDALDATVVTLPPLRLRTDEIGPLVTASTPGGIRWSRAALAVMDEHSWPGNVAELKLAVRSAVAAAAGRPVGVEHLPAAVRPTIGTRRLGPLEQAEAAVIRAVLSATGGNKTAAARQLRLSRPTLYAKLRAYRI